MKDQPTNPYRVVNAAGKREKSAFLRSGIVEVAGERIALINYDSVGGMHHQLLSVADASSKWESLERHAAAAMAGSPAPTAEFLSMLWSEAMRRERAD